MEGGKNGGRGDEEQGGGRERERERHLLTDLCTRQRLITKGLGVGFG